MTATLILGGARSGKSRRALALAADAATPRRFLIATAEPLDQEMADRIARHRSERGGDWTTLEVPLDVPSVLSQTASAQTVIVVDCLTVWLANLMHHAHNVAGASDALVHALSTLAGPVILVSNEVGLGLVPETPLGRAFRDAQGRLNQQLAAVCDRVELIAAGLPCVLKG